MTGSARAAERSSLGFETGGRIAKLSVDVGDRFSRGQILAELDAQPDRLRLTQAQASLAAAEASLVDRRIQTDQQRRLLESEVISPAAFENAKAQLAVAEGQARTAKAALGLAERSQRGTMIVAPFDGVVAERLALAYTDIAAGAPVFQVDGVRSGTEIIANASTTQASRIHVGQLAELSWGGAEQPVRAAVRRIGLRAENGSMLPVVLVPTDGAQARALRPGIAIQVVLDAPATTSATSQSDAVSIPYASLVLGTKPGEASVFVYTPADKKVRRRAVRFTPVHQGDSVRVLAGLKSGDSVVAAGGAWLTDGQPVTPLEATTQLTQR
ncbi:efflux RND transporter periplasmic adaptor subunit [Pseudomonas aeruginosa]